VALQTAWSTRVNLLRERQDREIRQNVRLRAEDVRDLHRHRPALPCAFALTEPDSTDGPRLLAGVLRESVVRRVLCRDNRKGS